MRGCAASLLALWLAAPPPAAADSASDAQACAERAVEAVQQRYRRLADLRARFEQTTRAVALGSAAAATQRASGRVWFAKPGKMRWSYEEPEPSLMVSDGRTLWLYDPTLGEAQRLPVGEGALSGAAIQFLLGEGDIHAAFEVRPEACDEASASLTLVPREPASYERLGIRADPRTGDVLETRIVDLLGNATEVRFSELEANRDPPADVFTFEVPEGVRVIDLAPPTEEGGGPG